MYIYIYCIYRYTFPVVAVVRIVRGQRCIRHTRLSPPDGAVHRKKKKKKKTVYTFARANGRTPAIFYFKRRPRRRVSCTTCANRRKLKPEPRVLYICIAAELQGSRKCASKRLRVLALAYA